MIDNLEHRRALRQHVLTGAQSEVIRAIRCPGGRAAPQFEVIKAIALEGSPCCEVPHRVRRHVQRDERTAARHVRIERVQERGLCVSVLRAEGAEIFKIVDQTKRVCSSSLLLSSRLSSTGTAGPELKVSTPPSLNCPANAPFHTLFLREVCWRSAHPPELKVSTPAHAKHPAVASTGGCAGNGSGASRVPHLILRSQGGSHPRARSGHALVRGPGPQRTGHRRAG